MKIWHIGLSCMALAFTWAVGEVVVERVAWRVADGVIGAKTFAAESTLRRGMGGYRDITGHIMSRLDDPDYTWEKAKPDILGMLNYQSEVLGVGDGIIKSYLYNHEEA